jgi:hypothetical protein
MNVSWDFSVYKNGTKEHPVELIPELNINVMKDLNQLSVR